MTYEYFQDIKKKFEEDLIVKIQYLWRKYIKKLRKKRELEAEKKAKNAKKKKSLKKAVSKASMMSNLAATTKKQTTSP